jgi:ubiquinone biosynthesis protein COQ4
MASLYRSCLDNSLRVVLTSRVGTQCISHRAFSVLNRPPPNYDGHVPLTRIERTALAVGSGVMAYLNPRRGGELS